MIEQVSQKKFEQMIMLVALAMCFKPNELYLSEDQIIDRGYAPIESYVKSCIAKLIDEGAIQFKLIEPTFPFEDATGMLFIKCPASAEQELEAYVYESAEKITRLMRHSFDYILYLKALYQEILACEVIEYTIYHSRKSGLDLQNYSPSNAKLKLLLADNSPEKVNAFMWRAVKDAKKKGDDNVKPVDFSEITDSAFEFYVRYQKLNIEVDGYNRPTHLKTSVLSGFLEFLRGSGNLNPNS